MEEKLQGDVDNMNIHRTDAPQPVSCLYISQIFISRSGFQTTKPPSKLVIW